MKIYTVLLEDGTVGKIKSDAACLNGMPADALIGEVVTVDLHDENGNSIEVEGRLEDVLEEKPAYAC